jgi:hypothetical protein
VRHHHVGRGRTHVRVQNLDGADGEGCAHDLATTNGATDPGAMPANVSDSVRASVTAGLAKLVDEVKK